MGVSRIKWVMAYMVPLLAEGESFIVFVKNHFE